MISYWRFSTAYEDRIMPSDFPPRQIIAYFFKTTRHNPELGIMTQTVNAADFLNPSLDFYAAEHPLWSAAL